VNRDDEAAASISSVRDDRTSLNLQTLDSLRRGAVAVGLIVTSAVRHGAYCDVRLIVTSAVEGVIVDA
jgi:hypothetical protein